MVIVLAHAQVVRDRLTDALTLAQAHVARSRREPGCITHAVYQDPEQPQRLVFVEEWVSEDALQQHFAVPQSAEFVNALGAMLATRAQIRMYRASELPFPGGRGA